MKCENCGAEVAGQATCPNCGHWLADQRANKAALVFWGCLAVPLALVGGCGLWVGIATATSTAKDDLGIGVLGWWIAALAGIPAILIIRYIFIKGRRR